MNDETIKRRLLSDEPLSSIITDLLVERLMSHPEILAAMREDEEYEQRVLYGDPSAPKLSLGIIDG
jgi:hypothetical protein